MNNLAQPGDTLPVGQYNEGLLILFIKVKQVLLFYKIIDFIEPSVCTAGSDTESDGILQKQESEPRPLLE